MSSRHRRFRGRWFRGRQSGSIAPERLESALREPVPVGGDDDSFAQTILDQVASERPFLNVSERRQIRWVRTVLSGTVLGLLIVGAIAVRQGLLPTRQSERPISAVIEVAQKQGQDRYEEAIAWRTRALERIADLSRQQNQQLGLTPGSMSVRFTATDRRAQPDPGVCIGFTMQEPYDQLIDSDYSPTSQLIVFDDGLAVPVAGSFGAFGEGSVSLRIERWPSASDACQLLVGEDRTGSQSQGILPPWYGSQGTWSASSDRSAAAPDVQSH